MLSGVSKLELKSSRWRCSKWAPLLFLQRRSEHKLSLFYVSLKLLKKTSHKNNFSKYFRNLAPDYYLLA